MIWETPAAAFATTTTTTIFFCHFVFQVVWDWDFDRDEGSVTFSTNFYRIDLILSVKYSLNVCNEIIVDLQACGSKIVPISLTSQVSQTRTSTSTVINNNNNNIKNEIFFFFP